MWVGWGGGGVGEVEVSARDIAIFYTNRLERIIYKKAMRQLDVTDASIVGVNSNFPPIKMYVLCCVVVGVCVCVCVCKACRCINSLKENDEMFLFCLLKALFNIVEAPFKKIVEL